MGKKAIGATLIGLAVLCSNPSFLRAAEQPAAAAAAQTKEQPAAAANQMVIPTIAIIPFSSRLTGSSEEGIGNSIADLLTGTMSATGEFDLADRSDINKVMGELKLSASGLVSKESQLKLCQLIGAKIIITGSVFKGGQKNYIVAKIIGVETSRVIGVSSSGPGTPLDLVPTLSTKISEKIKAQSQTLLPPTLTQPDVLTELKKKIGSGNGKKIYVNVNEQTVVNIDPAVNTELKHLLLKLGFKIAEIPNQADFRITGEGLAEESGEFKGFYSATARLELNVYRQDQLIAADRQVETVAGPAINIAAKNALAQAALALARRIIPELK